MKRLAQMKLKYNHWLKNGKQAGMSYNQWKDWLAELRKNAAKAKKTAGKAVTTTICVISKGAKITAVVTFLYIASTDSIAVAVEGGTRDALYPLPEVVEAIGSEFGGAVTPLQEAGQLSAKITEQNMLDLIEGKPVLMGPLSNGYLKGQGGNLPRR